MRPESADIGGCYETQTESPEPAMPEQNRTSEVEKVERKLQKVFFKIDCRIWNGSLFILEN